jgi:hypothetical protein
MGAVGFIGILSLFLLGGSKPLKTRISPKRIKRWITSEQRRRSSPLVPFVIYDESAVGRKTAASQKPRRGSNWDRRTRQLITSLIFVNCPAASSISLFQ